MKLAVISDLHLGVGDTTDDFGHTDTEFLRFLARLETDFERIVLLGDVWETLTARCPYAEREALKHARETHAALASRFERPNYTYIHGNHDLVAGRLEGVPAELLVDADGVRLLFTHGHHHDWLIRRARWLSESCVWLGAWIRRFGLNAVYGLGYLLDCQLSRPSVQPTKDSFQNWAFALAEHRRADVVVTGHTHFPLRTQRRANLFLNSGSCSLGRLSYLAIDTKAGIYDVCSA